MDTICFYTNSENFFSPYLALNIKLFSGEKDLHLKCSIHLRCCFTAAQSFLFALSFMSVFIVLTDCVVALLLGTVYLTMRKLDCFSLDCLLSEEAANV